MKSPFDRDIKSLYRRDTCAKLVSDLIRSYEMEPFCLVQSFDFEILDEINRLNSVTPEACCIPIKTLYIHNFYYDQPVANPEEALQQGAGGHM